MTGSWRADATSLWLDEQPMPHEARNCEVIYGHGTVYTKDLPADVVCPFSVEPLSAGERCLVGEHSNVSGTNTITHTTVTLKANRLYEKKIEIDMVYSPDSKSWEYGYWSAKDGQLTVERFGDKPDDVIPVQVDPAAGTCKWWDSTYDHVVGDTSCDPVALAGTGTSTSCTSGDYQCNGDSLDECVGGTWSTQSCTSVCTSSGYTLPKTCDFDPGTGHDVCFCFSGEIGEPCAVATDCKSAFCGAGVCSKACASDTDCGTDSYGRANHCMKNPSGSTTCYASCETSADCAVFALAKTCLTGVTNAEGKPVTGVCTTQ
jgi:hypothetical protein